MARHVKRAREQSTTPPRPLSEQLRELEASQIDPGPHLAAIERRIIAAERKLFPKPLTNLECDLEAA